ncbi:cation-transporting P-type ATPase [Psychroflexus lacisalsi]|jgi:magnesium-transporting ATPase (P-type)|uniref:cation-transporting P-type ATPase n=1 Tax=Psychroflexus lacisalsi TaxID=503928 RepID=UPI001CCEBEE8|nr:hypothetical protein [Psychroflexus lacisalsi]
MDEHEPQKHLRQKHWQANNKEEIFSELRTSDTGLKQEEINNRIQFYGENKLPQGQNTCRCRTNCSRWLSCISLCQW